VAVPVDTQHFLRLEIVSPDGPVYEGDVAMVIIPAVGGEMGILPRHAPMVAALAIGESRVKTPAGEWFSMAVAQGFAKVQFDKVIILADAAELASEVDLERAEQAYDEAQKKLETCRLGAADEDNCLDPHVEEKAVARAKNRIKVVRKV